jgi:diguanylate cyclase
MFQSTAAVMGIISGVTLLGVGYYLGRKYAPVAELPLNKDLVDDAERARILELLKKLAQWTTDYSGDILGYQNKLVELDKTLQASHSPGDNRFVLMLKQIIASNEQLKTRLDAAESQLAKQTLQIESYLSEARTDGLTGLANRRAFDKKLDEMFLAYRAGGRSFVVGLVDIDKFKVINDTHGHPAGDQVLREVAGILRASLQEADIVARFGGEEFAVILPGPLTTAARRMNEVRKQVQSHHIKTEQKEIEVTASMGVSEPLSDLVVALVLRRADEALYAAKNVGRNKVYFHDGKQPVLVGAPEVVR